MPIIKGIANKFKNQGDTDLFNYFEKEKMEKVHHFHKGLPGYKETELIQLNGLAEYLGLENIYVKNENQRFGLNAFKGLGASYAVAQYFAAELNLDLSEVGFQELKDKINELPKKTLATATDGNHGKSLAWAAQVFNQSAQVFMPKGSSPVRLDAVRNFGAEVTETDENYDNTVSMTADLAKENDWILVQDTAWEGYEEIPLSVMQGYSTILSEILEQFGQNSFEKVTHVVLQAGVGSFAASIIAAINEVTKGNNPYFIIVEPNKADPLYRSAVEPEGEPVRVYGDLGTIMAGLACGEPNPTAWKILKNQVDYFYSLDDSISERGMKILGNPVAGDRQIISGESGGVPLGFIYEILTRNRYGSIREKLKLTDSSQILFINTEGDTDPENYRKIVWE